MTSTLPLKQQERSFNPTISKTDQELALTCIEDIAFVDQETNSPSAIFSLPRRLTVFPNSRSCLLVYGCRLGDGYNPVRAAVPLLLKKQADGMGWKYLLSYANSYAIQAFLNTYMLNLHSLRLLTMSGTKMRYNVLRIRCCAIKLNHYRHRQRHTRQSMILRLISVRFHCSTLCVL